MAAQLWMVGKRVVFLLSTVVRMRKITDVNNVKLKTGFKLYKAKLLVLDVNLLN